MKLRNAQGEMVYYNIVEKNGKTQWVIKGIGETVVVGRDRERRKSRSFSREHLAEQYLKRHGFKGIG